MSMGIADASQDDFSAERRSEGHFAVLPIKRSHEFLPETRRFGKVCRWRALHRDLGEPNQHQSSTDGPLPARQ